VHATTSFGTHDQEEAMELADQIVLVNDGRVEQCGTPDELYDAPVTPFVMGFLGPVTRLGGELVRPHDVEILRDPVVDGVRATVERVVELGFQSRVELLLTDGRPVTVQLTRAQVRELAVRPRDAVFVKHVAGDATAVPVGADADLLPDDVVAALDAVDPA